jgi:hypothetical protein
VLGVDFSRVVSLESPVLCLPYFESVCLHEERFVPDSMELCRRISKQGLMRPDFVVIVDIASYAASGRLQRCVSQAVDLFLRQGLVETLLASIVSPSGDSSRRKLDSDLRKKEPDICRYIRGTGISPENALSSWPSIPSLITASATRSFTSGGVTVLTMPQATTYREKTSRIVNT